MKKVVDALILSNEKIAFNIYSMTIRTAEIASEADAGQFVELYTGRQDLLLPRPISICEIDTRSGSIRLVYQVVGEGTKLFSDLRKGDTIKVMGPCGNGYVLEEYKSIALIGGGIGTPPLLETAKRLREINTAADITAILGYRTEPFLISEFERCCDVHIATDDGSCGFHGNVVDLLRELKLKPNIIYSCGPKIMLKNLSKFADEKNILCFVSMEERMACGIGACVGCAVKVHYRDSFVYKKVCVDGPVFDSKDIIWD